MKFYQMKMTDIVRTTASEIAEIELAETEFSEIAEIQCLVEAVFRFVVAVVSFAYLINFRIDAVPRFVVVVALVVTSIADAPTVALIAVRRTRVSDAVMLMKNLK